MGRGGNQVGGAISGVAGKHSGCQVGGGSGGCQLLPIWINIGHLAGGHGLFGLLKGKMRELGMIRDPETLRD